MTRTRRSAAGKPKDGPVAAGVAVAVLLLLGGCHKGPPSGQTLTGTFTLTPATARPDPCTPPTGFQDIAKGAPVTVKNESGATIGTGPLGDGALDATKKSCVFSFTVTGLPAATAYVIGVANRAGISFSAAELASKGWKVDLRLGTP